MAVTVKHAFTSAKSDGADATLVQPSSWNADHSVSGLTTVATDAIWDAAGDLAVGSGSDTASRLAKGAAGGVLAMGNSAVIWNAGTSFPASKATGDRYYRTDLAMEFYYDGTRWLSCQEFSLHTTLIDVLQPVSTNISGAFATVDEGPSSAGAYCTRMVCSTLVTSTNDGSKYWTVTPASMATNATVHNLGSAFNTSGDTVGVWARHLVSVGSVVTSGDIEYRFPAAKTSTPGGLYILAAVYYRLIAT